MKPKRHGTVRQTTSRSNYRFFCTTTNTSTDRLDVNEIEGAIPASFGHDSRPVPGAIPLLQQLNDAQVPWAIVTSCTRALLYAWAAKLALPLPTNTITAEDVAAGKPDPACYRLAKDFLDLGPTAPVLIFEDSPTGVRAGKAAECMVLGVGTTTDIEKLLEAGADWVVSDLQSVELGRQVRGGWEIHFRDVLGRKG